MVERRILSEKNPYAKRNEASVELEKFSGKGRQETAIGCSHKGRRRTPKVLDKENFCYMPLQEMKAALPKRKPLNNSQMENLNPNIP